MKHQLKLDADFSIERVLTDDGRHVFQEMQRCLASRFSAHDFELIDFRANRRPHKLRKGFPHWWGGWACEFKLVDRKTSMNRGSIPVLLCISNISED